MHNNPLRHIFKSMFENMVIAKDVSLIEKYYHPEFSLFANSKTMNYNEFYDIHAKIYATDIQYQIAYDECTWAENDDKIAGRLFISLTNPNKPARELELICIVQYRQQKIYRLWELTFPDWANMDDFNAAMK